MAFHDRDLLHRRLVPATTSIQKSDLNDKHMRRKRRVNRQQRSMLVAAAAVAGTLMLITVIFVRRETPKTDMKVKPSLKDWKPRLKKSLAASLMHNNDEKAGASKRAHMNHLQSKHEANGELYRHKFSADELGYDIYNCPVTPPEDYPKAWPVTDIIDNWNPNEVTTIPPKYREVYHSLCIFDYQMQYEAALAYRNAEKPFIVRNDPRVTAVSTKWSTPGYLLDVLPTNKIYTERSPINHFMFYNPRSHPKDWVKPLNDVISMRYDEWLERSLERDAIALNDIELMKRVHEMKEKRMARELAGEEEEEVHDDPEVEQDNDHDEKKRMKWYYWRLNAFVEQADEEGTDKLVFDDMPFFDPRTYESQFYLIDPTDQRGINCRFGMRGVIAESHCDLSRNMIALLDGERRYIIGHPNTCSNLYLYPRGHPSGRHASFDWSNPTNWDLHPKFHDALHSEVVMKPGDVLYLPTAWFHYIVNLSTNIQCNIRSGISYENEAPLKECGFKLPKT